MNKGVVYCNTIDCMKLIKKKYPWLPMFSYGEFFLQRNYTCIKLV